MPNIFEIGSSCYLSGLDLDLVILLLQPPKYRCMLSCLEKYAYSWGPVMLLCMYAYHFFVVKFWYPFTF